jgi:peptidoglycan-associated lipoprotein
MVATRPHFSPDRIQFESHRGDKLTQGSSLGPNQEGLNNVNYWKKGLMIGAALGAMSLSACATEDFVNKKVEPVNALAEKNQNDLQATQGQVTTLSGTLDTTNQHLQANDARLAGLDQTTKEAMMRADAAGKLAEGKFLYSVVLSDDGVKFPVAAAKLSKEAEDRLSQLADKLKSDNKNVFLEIQGYTDATGAPAVNDRLGQERADAVRKFLSEQGVPLNRMSTISYGEDKPVAPNKTKKGRAENRRVVVVVLS